MSERRPALLVVDVQNDFCPGGALAVKDGDEVVAPLNRAIRFFEEMGWPIFFSRDWHPEKTKHFENWPIHCVQNTEGAEFHPNLRVPPTSRIIIKGYSDRDDGYSPFEGVCLRENDWPLSFKNLLGSPSKIELYVGGLATDYCVKAACLDARKLGYTTYLMTDACKAVNLDPLDGAKARAEMLLDGVILTTTDEVLRQKGG